MYVPGALNTWEAVSPVAEFRLPEVGSPNFQVSDKGGLLRMAHMGLLNDAFKHGDCAVWVYWYSGSPFYKNRQDSNLRRTRLLLTVVS